MDQISNDDTFRPTAVGTIRFLAALVFTLMMAGCAQVRLLTYPAEFTYLDSSSVQGVMHEMAISIGELDQLIRRASDDQLKAAYQQQILRRLDTIENLAASLGSSTTDITPEGQPRVVTNHLLIDEHIDDFIEQLLRARLMAESDPPNYYGIGQLSGNCSACHRLR